MTLEGSPRSTTASRYDRLVNAHALREPTGVSASEEHAAGLAVDRALHRCHANTTVLPALAVRERLQPNLQGTPRSVKL